MNELQIFNNPRFNESQVFDDAEYENIRGIEKSLKGSFFGIVYGLEFGNLLKIGCTKKPYERLIQLKNVAKYGDISLGQVCISQPHTNYRINEYVLHKLFFRKRKRGTELFELSIYDFEKVLQSDYLEYLNETRIIQEKIDITVEMLKRTLFINPQHQSDVTQGCQELIACIPTVITSLDRIITVQETIELRLTELERKIKNAE